MMRVLIVDDDVLNRGIMAEALIDAGFLIEEARSADEAVRMLAGGEYGLVVTDIHMPGRLDGIDLAQHVHDHHPLLPVLVVTGRPEVLARLRDAGLPGASLAKPFAQEALVSVVNRLIASTP